MEQKNIFELDKTIVQRANILIEGQGDGRISENDMIELLKLDYNTPEKVETLLYIYSNYTLTDNAKKTLLTNIIISN